MRQRSRAAFVADHNRVESSYAKIPIRFLAKDLDQYMRRHHEADREGSED